MSVIMSFPGTVVNTIAGDETNADPIPAYPIRGNEDLPVLPFSTAIFLPFDFLEPSDRMMKLEHIHSSHVYAWDNRFKKDLNLGIVPDATDEDKERVYKVTYTLKKMVIDKMRLQISARLVEIGKNLYAGNKLVQFTLFGELAKICVEEVNEGRSDIPWRIKYDNANFPPLWEVGYQGIFCQANGITLRLWTRDSTFQKGCFAKIATYVLGQLRSKIHNVTRRLPAPRDNDGNAVRRRFKHAVAYDPMLHAHAAETKKNKRTSLQYNQL